MRYLTGTGPSKLTRMIGMVSKLRGRKDPGIKVVDDSFRPVFVLGYAMVPAVNRHNVGFLLSIRSSSDPLARTPMQKESRATETQAQVRMNV